MELFLQNLYKATLLNGRWLLYIEGLGNTIAMAILACIFGTIIALCVALINYFALKTPNKLLKFLSKLGELYVTIIRGTPIVIQLLIAFNLVFVGGFPAAVFAFSINSGAYVSEIIRAGIASVDVGQTEAGRSLGLSASQTMRLIVLPQAIKNILPSLFNELIALFKETAVAGMIAVRDLTKISDSIRGITFNSMPLFIAAGIYLAVVILMTKIQRNLEKRLSTSDKS